jgi:hypothetical protein
VLPPTGTVLEIASGTGEHAIYFAPRLAPRLWLPSDAAETALASINAWRERHPAENLLPPLTLNVMDAIWPAEIQKPVLPISAIVAINLIHIAPWAACLGLMAGAARILKPGDVLVLYGPFRERGEHTAPSNAAFDVSLRAQNPNWGVRDVEEVSAAAGAAGLRLDRTASMSANNLTVVFRRKLADYGMTA